MQPRGDHPYIISFRLEHLLGWAVTLVLCLVPVYFWAQLNHPLHVATTSQLMINVGRVTGLIGMVMYALNLVYATRLRFLEFCFGGLNRVYIAHHILGGLALIFLTLHPLFLALRYIQVSLLQVSLFLIPNGLQPMGALFNPSSPYHSQVLQQWAVTLGIVAFWGLVGLLLVTFFIQLPYRIWLWTHKFLGVFFIIGGLHMLFIQSDTSISQPLRWYIIVITVIGTTAYLYRTLFSRIVIRHYRYMVQNIVNAGGGVMEIMMVPEGQPMRYTPGQFLFIRFIGSEDTGASNEWHPFSITSTPDSPLLSIGVKSLGDYTEKLVNLQPGTTAEVEGAYGRFGYANFKNPNQIWIAGGIGITPFLSMAKSLPHTGYAIDLYYSVRTASEVVNWQTIYTEAMARYGTFRVIPYIRDQQTGHLSVDYIERFSGPVKDKDIYICGPPAMMKSLRKQLRDRSVPGTSIHTEEFAMS